MRWRHSSQMFNILFVTIIFSLLLEGDCKIRRRRQYLNTNFGNVAINPDVASYYGMSGTGQFTGNGPETNRFVAGGFVYRYPTPVNVLSGGSYNPQDYNVFPSGANAYHYDNINNMRLPTEDGWYPQGYIQRYPFLTVFNRGTSSHYASTSSILQWFLFMAMSSLYVVCLYR